MAVEAIRLMDAGEPYSPKPERTGGDILQDAISESLFGTIGGWIDREKAKTGEALDVSKGFEPVTKKIGPVTSDEMFMVTMEGYEDVGQAAQAIIESRAKEKRQRRISQDGIVESFIANTVAYGPLLGLEYSMYRTMGGTMAARYLPQAMRHPVSRDIVAAGSVEFSAEAFRTALDPVDGVDEAIKNGAYATAFSGAMIGGIELARKGMARGADSFIDSMVDRSKNLGSRQAAAEMAPGYIGTGGKWRAATLRNKEWDEIAESYGYEKGKQNAAKWRNSEMTDGFKGQHFVAPKGQTSPAGDQILIVSTWPARKLGFKLQPRSRKAILHRSGDNGEWSLVGETRTNAQARAQLDELYPLATETDDFLNAVASQTIRSNRADMISHYRRADTEPPANTARERRAALTTRQRMDRIENTLRAEVDDLKAQARDTALKRTAAEKAGDTQKAKLLAKRADDQSMKAGKAERDLNFWVKEGAPEDWVFQGKGAETTVQLFRKTGQLPAWNVWGNKVLRQYPVMRQWSEAVERLAGTNGAMLPDPSRPAVDSVVGGQHMWNQKFEVFHAKMRDIYGELHGMEQGALTPAKLRMRRTYQWASRRWKTARNQEGTGPMSWDEFQYTVQQATIDNVELGQTHPNPIIQRAVATTIEYGQELEAAAKNANVFASAQSIQRNIDEANNALENISPGLRKHELAFRKEIDKLDETQMLQRYKETATSQQKLREAGKEDGDEWDRNGIELAVIRNRLNKSHYEAVQKEKANLSEEDIATLKEIQEGWEAVSNMTGGLTASDVFAKFKEMKPLLAKLSLDTLNSWRAQKAAKEYSGVIRMYINREIAAIDRAIAKKKGVEPNVVADPEAKKVEQIWTSTKHLEVDPPSLLNERLNRKLADLEDRLKQARADGFSQHLTRRFDTAKIDARIEDFKEILRKYFTDHPERYAGDKKPRSTDPADIEKRVNETIQRIHGENVYDDIAGQMNFDEAGRPLSNGALSRRRLDIPSHLVRDFLEPFQIDVMATATKKIGGAIEMVRATGDQSGENMIQDLIDKSLAQGVPAETVEEMAGELRALRDSALGIDGLGVDPTRWDTRALRMARWINVAAFMGRVPQVMTIDLGYAVHIAGFKKLLQATNLNTQGLSTRMGEILKKDAGLWLAGTEVNQASRSASIFNDPVGSVQAKTPVERAAQGAADNVFFYTGASWFTDWIRRQSGLLTSHEVLRLSDKVVDGTISNADKARLRSFGIDDDVAARINAEWKRIPAEDRAYQAQFGSGEINMANATEWEDQTLASFFASKIRMELDNIVPQMNAGTRPKIMKSEWGRALMLYSSIGVHMTQTVNMRMMQRGPRNAIAAATSMILAGYLVENMRKPDYISDDPEDAFYGAVMISGVGGFPLDAFDRLSQVTGSSLGLQVMGIDPPPWSDQFNPGRINPITSQLGDFGMSLLPGTEWNDRLRAWKYMFPYNNMWQWKSTYDLPNEIREWASE